ncbi:MAG: D-glycero-beta-D-manno-heptose-7-phosphate kinase [Candidatus Omnitrophica bacterium]|nr:D-glycero-beta-D-manno-heptose-7-phosphate kinase [Candidatus Omnitrophota bacterium]
MKERITLTKTKKKQLTELVEKFARVKLLIIGDFILDQYIFGKVSRISPEAPVPVVDVDVRRETYVPGGALNVGNNIKELGATVFPCGAIGRDLYGRMFLKRVKSEGIDSSGIIIDNERPTTLKTRVIAHSQQVVRIDRESREDISHNERRKVIDFCRKKVKDVDGIIIEDYGKGVISPELLKEISILAKRYNKFIAVDPKEKHFQYYKNVTIITPNKKEAYCAVGVSLEDKQVTIEDVGKRILKKIGCQAVLITLGEEGMALFEGKGKISKIPTAAQEVFDVSGAGDTVIAVLSLALGAGANFQDAALIANCAAGIVVGKVGAAAITKEELVSSINT